MTSVCHPFILIGTVLLPDDCSDVYHQLEYVLIYYVFFSPQHKKEIHVYNTTKDIIGHLHKPGLTK